MLPLITEEYKSWKNSEECYIFKETFDKKDTNYRGHFTSKYLCCVKNSS